jgi:hypothetical protein
LDIALSFAEKCDETVRRVVFRRGYQIPKPISVMLSASQPKRPMAMIVSRLVVESDRFSDGLWEGVM